MGKITPLDILILGGRGNDVLSALHAVNFLCVRHGCYISSFSRRASMLLLRKSNSSLFFFVTNLAKSPPFVHNPSAFHNFLLLFPSFVQNPRALCFLSPLFVHNPSAFRSSVPPLRPDAPQGAPHHPQTTPRCAPSPKAPPPLLPVSASTPTHPPVSARLGCSERYLGQFVAVPRVLSRLVIEIVIAALLYIC